MVPFYIREFGKLDSLVFHETGGAVDLEFVDSSGGGDCHIYRFETR